MATRKEKQKDWTQNIQHEADKLVSGKKFTDERFWTLTKDKATGNGYAVIRFLPPHADDDLPMVKYFSHSFKSKSGQWYIEKSRTTLANEQDPCGELNSLLWNTGTEANKNIARDQKRKLTFISNILVIEDPANPENEGKVFLFKYGKKIFNKINEAMSPDEYAKKHKGVKAFIPFEYKDGANFALESKKVAGYINYDTSAFQTQSDISEADQKEIEGQLSSLKEFVSEDSFKSYDDLKKRLIKVLGPQPHGFDLFNNDTQSYIPAQPTEAKEAVPEPSVSVSDDDEFSMEEFEQLAVKPTNG